MNTLSVGNKVTIKYSKQLFDNGNDSLVNKTGVITQLLKIGKNVVGVYVDVRVMRRIKNYYIPVCSVEGPCEISKTRTLSILKSTIL